MGFIHTYHSVMKSWMSTFDISTNDDWYGVLRLGTTFSSPPIAYIFCVSVVYILNIMIWGLVMAFLLDQFSKKLGEEEEVVEQP